MIFMSDTAGQCIIDSMVNTILGLSQPDEVIIVNAGKVNPSNLQLDASVSDDMIQDRIEGFFVERMADLKHDREVQGDEGWSEGYKPQKIVDAMTIRFVSMPEYLKTFDWTGEFTDEEVAPWLEDIGKAGE